MVFDTFNDNQNAFVFGTNPLGIEYRRPGGARGTDAAASRPAAAAPAARSAAASARSIRTGTATGPCKSQITERGWEAELAIPLKTLRYQQGDNQTWGFNVLRNIRHKNEQVYLAPIPRGFDIYRVSLAAKMSGLNLPARRDIKLIPYGAWLREQGLHPRRRTGRRQLRFRRRPEVGHPSQPHARCDLQHRLRAGRSGRRAGQPDALRSVLPGEAPVLPGERVDVPVRQPAADRFVLLAAHRPVGLCAADRHPRRWPPERQVGRLERRRAEHPGRRCRGFRRQQYRAGEQFQRHPHAA